MKQLQRFYLCLVLVALHLNVCMPACTTTNFYKTIAASTINSVSKLNTGTDNLVVAATVSSTCRLIVFDARGTKLIEKQVGDSSTDLTVCNKIVTTATGNIYVTGSTVTLEGSSGSTNLLVGKYDSSSMTVGWVKGWGGSTGNEVGLDIKITLDEGYVYAVGYSNKFTLSTGNNNPVVARFQASDGAHIWSKSIGGSATGKFNSVDIPDDDSYVYCAGTTQIWTITSGKNAGVLVKVSSTGSLQWVRQYSVASTDIAFNKVIVLKDHTNIWTFGNSAGTTGIMVKWTTAGVDSLTLSLASMADIKTASLFIDQSVIFIGGQTSASKMYVGALKLSDTTLILDKYFDQASSSTLDISVNNLGHIGVGGSFGALGSIINFDSDLNDKCTDLAITAFSGLLTASSTAVSTAVTYTASYQSDKIFPTMVTGTITDSTSTTTITAKTCGEVCVPIYAGSSLTVGNTLTASAATFGFATLGTTFTYTISLMDNSSPGGWWLSISSGGTFSGTSTAGGTTYVKVKASYTDTVAYSSNSVYKVVVTNTAPVISVAIPDQTTTVNNAFSFGFTNSVFTDANAGDSLKYSAKQTSGSVLPSWLNFDSTNKLFAGTPRTAGTFSIRVTATDLGGSSVNDIFDISVTNTNPVAATAIGTQKLIVGEAFVFSIPSGAFTDANGHTITYVSATQTDLSALPSWITFKKDAGYFLGTPTAAGILSVRITATDGYGGTNPTMDFNFVTNTRPTVSAYTDLNKVVGDTISVSTPFSDSDGDTLIYSAALANGSSTITPFTLSTAGTLSNTAFTAAQEGRWSVRVTATDTSSNSITSTQNVIVNSPPTANQSVLSQLYALDGEAFYYSLPTSAFTDTDALTYSIGGGSTHPAWLSFDAKQRIFYGTGAVAPAPNSPALTIVATDTMSQTANVVLNITLQTDTAPTLVGTISGKTIKNYAGFSIKFSDTVFADADGDPVELSFVRNAGGAMPSWWSYNPITRVASGTANTTETSIVVKVWGGTAVSTTFTLTISPNNNPVAGTAISSMTVYQDIDFSEYFASTSFTDPDGDTLTYTLEAVSAGSAFPQWVRINSSTRTLYGRPIPPTSGDYKVNVVASDSRGGTTYQTVSITVQSSYNIGGVLALSLFTILPVLLMIGYFSAIMFIPHESPKYAFDLQDFLSKYNPKSLPSQEGVDIEDKNI